MRSKVKEAEVETEVPATPSTAQVAPAALAVVEAKRDITPPTAAEKAAADKNWDEHVTFFRNRISDVSKNILMLHWEEGQFLDECMQDRKYGDNLIGRYIKDMKAKGTVLSESGVYKCLQAGQRLTKQEVKEYTEAGITWGQVCNILLNAPTYDARAAIVETIKKGECENDEELKKEARKINETAKKEIRASGKKVSNKGGAHDRVIVRSTTNVCTAVSTKLEEFTTIFQNIVKMEDSKLKGELLVAVRDAFRAMDELKKRLDDAEELRGKLLD